MGFSVLAAATEAAMIFESEPWKNALLRDARTLRRFKAPTASPHRRISAIERAVFVSAFSMRKLWDAQKLSSSWRGRSLPCCHFALKGDIPNLLNWHRIEEFYSMDAPIRQRLSALDFCHAIIHTIIFIPSVEDAGGLGGLIFASDVGRRQRLTFVAIDDLITLLERAGNDYPSESRYTRTADGQFEAWLGGGDPKKRKVRRQ
jgi:hypothetical protein